MKISSSESNSSFVSQKHLKVMIISQHQWTDLKKCYKKDTEKNFANETYFSLKMKFVEIFLLCPHGSKISYAYKYKI